MHGFLNIDKPLGMTSHDVVAYIRRRSGQKRAGHAGTLDPSATGVLIIGLGKATRLIPYVQDETLKRYTGIVTLGIQTTTDDAEGDIIATAPVPNLTQADLDQIVAPLRGNILQIPPMYAALHHNGQRLYDLARRGEIVERVARPVLVEQLDILAWHSPELTLDIVCGKGTYIRALARDLGHILGCGAHLSSLRRTAVGSFRIEQAIGLEQLNTNVEEHVLSPEVALTDWLRLQPTTTDIQRLYHGLPIPAAPEIIDRRAYVQNPEGLLVALVERRMDSWHPFRVFNG